MKTKAQLAYEFDVGITGLDGRSSDRQINGVVSGTLSASTEFPTLAQKVETMRHIEGMRERAALHQRVENQQFANESLVFAAMKTATTCNLLDANRCVYTVLYR